MEMVTIETQAETERAKITSVERDEAEATRFSTVRSPRSTQGSSVVNPSAHLPLPRRRAHVPSVRIAGVRIDHVEVAGSAVGGVGERRRMFAQRLRLLRCR